jgi:aerobic carbon-monoxide dehydrogenase medium subunit
MDRFEYVAAETLEDALRALAEHREEAKVLAGGQSLVPMLHYRLARPRVVVDINGLPLGDISIDDGHLRLGALVRYHELEESDVLARHCPVLGEAAGLIGNVRVRTLGTVGGSLAHADPAAELPAVMTALDARIAVASASGRRTIGAREFFIGPLSTALAPDEIVIGVEATAPGGHGWAIEEMSRRAGDFAVAAVVALVSLDRRGRVDDVRLAFGGVSDRPVHGRAAEDALRGREPTTEAIAGAVQAARDALDPPSDAFVSGAYRRLVVGVLCRRALARAVERALGRT